MKENKGFFKNFNLMELLTLGLHVWPLISMLREKSKDWFEIITVGVSTLLLFNNASQDDGTFGNDETNMSFKNFGGLETVMALLVAFVGVRSAFLKKVKTQTDVTNGYMLIGAGALLLWSGSQSTNDIYTPNQFVEAETSSSVEP